MATAVAPVPLPPPPLPNPLTSVLLVDENPSDLYAYSRILMQEGYAIRACESYSEGTRSLEIEGFDLVIISQGCPDSEWRSMLEQAISVDSRRPVVVITECVDMKCYLDAMWLGAADYLEKPRSSRELITNVGKFFPSLGSCA